MSQNIHIKTQKNKELVYSLAFDGISKKRIAEYLGVSVPTLNQHYSQEYIRGNVDAERECHQVIRETMNDKQNLTAAICRAKFLGACEAKPESVEEEQHKILEHRIVRIDHNNYKEIQTGIIVDQDKETINNNNN